MFKTFRNPFHKIILAGLLLFFAYIFSFLYQSGVPDRVAAAPVTPTANSFIVARVFFTYPEQLQKLSTRLDIWEIDSRQGYLLALLSPQDQEWLKLEGFSIEVDFELTSSANRALTRLPDQTSGIPAFPCYRTVEETFTSMQQLAEEHSNLASWKDIGDSWEKTTPSGSMGYDIFVLVLTNKSITIEKPIFFLIAEIHARELTTAETAARFAEYLIEQYGVNPDITWLLDYTEIHIVPMSNPDGRKIAETGILHRKNTNTSIDACTIYSGDYGSLFGIDLNRNSSFQWGGLGSSANPCSETYRGPYASSEPETQALQNYIQSIYSPQSSPSLGQPASIETRGLFITLHSYGSSILYPWAYTLDPAPNYSQLKLLAEKIAFFNNYQVGQSSSPLSYLSSGTTDDWAYANFGIPSYTFELGSTFFETCANFEDIIYPHNRDGLLYAFKTAIRPYIIPAGPDILQLHLSRHQAFAGEQVYFTAQADDTRISSETNYARIIADARYTLDTPSWIAGTIPYSSEASDDEFDSTIEDLESVIDTTCLSVGRHTLFVESKDSAENWGPPSAVFLQIQSGKGFSLSPQSNHDDPLPGEYAYYQLLIKNGRSASDTFTIDTSSKWDISAPEHVFVDGGCTTQPFSIAVNVPISTPIGISNVSQITVTSQLSPSVFSTATLTTLAGPVYKFSAVSTDNRKRGSPGQDLDFTIILTNTGIQSDSYAISQVDGDWQSTTPLLTDLLTPEESTKMTFSVKIPLDTRNDESETILIEIASQNNPHRKVQLEFEIKAGWKHLLPIIRNDK